MLKKNLNKLPFYFFSILPIIYIIGNAITDIVMSILSVYALFNYKKNILDINRTFFYLLIFILFTSIISLNILSILDYLILSRFLLVYFFISLCLNEEEVLQNFYLYSFIGIILVCVFNIVQYFDPLIFEWSQVNTSVTGEVVRVGGLFRDELISGAYLLYFAPFGIIFLIKSLNKYLIILIYLFLIFISIFFSGERSALFSFFLFIILYSFNNFKKTSFLFIFMILSLVLFSISNFYILKRYSYDLFDSLSNLSESAYLGLFNAPIKILVNNPLNLLFGFGADSFERVCNRNIENFGNYLFTCNLHPHNFYLEILFSFGVIPILLLIYIYIKQVLFFLLNFKKIYVIDFVLFVSTIVFFMPFKTTGSIFSQRFGLIFFIYLSILFFLNKKYKLLE